MTRRPARTTTRGARRGGAPTGPAVEWRGGVHLRGTPVWCDALRTREACFVSSALVHEGRRHRQIIATAATLALLPGSGALAAKRAPRALAVPFGRSFTLGDARLELFPSGAMFGAASLHTDFGGTRVVYAGTVDPRGRPVAGAAELRVCDVLVIDATFAHPRFVLPPAAEALAALRGWVQETLAQGATPVLLAPTLALGPELIAELGASHSLRADRGLVEAARKLRALGVDLPPVARLVPGVPPAAGEVVIWPPARREAAAIKGLLDAGREPGRRPGARLALVSGWARDPDVLARLRVDAAFPLGEQADHPALLEYILATGARVVHLLSGGGREAELVAALAARGVRAQRLGPPEQLSLL